MEELLGDHELGLAELEFPRLEATLEMLRARPPGELYRLLCEWHDVVECHMPAGYTQLYPNSWVHRAAACREHFRHLVSGTGGGPTLTVREEADAHTLFRQMVDVDLAHFSFGHALRWVYFQGTEFADCEPFALQALSEAARI